MAGRKQGRVRRWIKRLFGSSSPPPEPPPDPPFDEPALVGQRPRPPQPSDAVALELPDEPDDVDARGSSSS